MLNLRQIFDFAFRIFIHNVEYTKTTVQGHRKKSRVIIAQSDPRGRFWMRLTFKSLLKGIFVAMNWARLRIFRLAKEQSFSFVHHSYGAGLQWKDKFRFLVELVENRARAFGCKLTEGSVSTNHVERDGCVRIFTVSGYREHGRRFEVVAPDRVWLDGVLLAVVSWHVFFVFHFLLVGVFG